MTSERFDDVARQLATTQGSRRQLLKAFVAGAVAMVVAGRGRVSAQAVSTAKTTCAAFCDQVFGPGTPLAKQCRTDAESDSGLCYTCGPKSPGGTKPICCTRNLEGFCTGNASCCATGTTCVNGVCQTACPPSDVCTTGNSTCPGAPCQGDPSCICTVSAEGCPVCVHAAICTDLALPCVATSDCAQLGSNFICATTTCCAAGICVPRCGSLASQ